MHIKQLELHNLMKHMHFIKLIAKILPQALNADQFIVSKFQI